MNDLKSGLAVICLAMLLAGCVGAVGNADAGPNPGGGFYDGPNINVGHINPSRGGFHYAPNINVGHINPSRGGFHYAPYTSLGQANP